MNIGCANAVGMFCNSTSNAGAACPILLAGFAKCELDANWGLCAYAPSEATTAVQRITSVTSGLVRRAWLSEDEFAWIRTFQCADELTYGASACPPFIPMRYPGEGGGYVIGPPPMTTFPSPGFYFGPDVVISLVAIVGLIVLTYVLDHAAGYIDEFVCVR